MTFSHVLATGNFEPELNCNEGSGVKPRAGGELHPVAKIRISSSVTPCTLTDKDREKTSKSLK